MQILYFRITGDCIINCPKANNYLSYMYIDLNSCWYSSRANPKTSYVVNVYNLNIITGKGSEDRACAAQKKEEKSAQTSRKGDVSFIFINVYAFTILIEVYQDLYAYHSF